MKEKRSKESAHAHPGEVLRKVFLIPLGISQNRLAREIGVPPRRINEIVLEKRAVTADTAIRLARYFGTSEGFWMGLQAGYDLEKTHRLYGDRFEKEVKTGVSGIDGTVKSAFPSDSKACDAEDSKSALEDHGGRRGEADRERILKILWDNLEEIQERFAVKSLALFGSTARGESGRESDLDILVSFENTPGMFGFLDLKNYLEALFQRPVDLVTEKSLKKQLREKILREAVDVRQGV